MTYEAREFARVTKTVLMISVAAWIILLAPGGITPALHRHDGHFPSMLQTMPSHLLLAVLPGTSLMMGFAVMLVAMMSPALIAPICDIRLRSFRCRRVRAVALFVITYTSAWLALGYLALTVTAAVGIFTGRSCLPAAIVLVIALIWQFSPAKQRCLNGCHRHGELAAFGAAADADALRYGFNHAVWCVGSCWALMLLPMLLSAGHVVAMVGVTALIFSERLEDPGLPSWKWRGCNKAVRIVVGAITPHLHTTQTFPVEGHMENRKRSFLH